jgi:hypothetical protein
MDATERLLEVARNHLRRVGLRASDRREPYQLVYSPELRQLPPALQQVYRSGKLPYEKNNLGLVVVVLECKLPGGKPTWLRHAATIRRDRDWDYAALEPTLTHMQIKLLALAEDQGWNPVRFIDPAKVPAKRLPVGGIPGGL